MKIFPRIVCSSSLIGLLLLLTAAGVHSEPASQIGKDSEFNEQERMGHAFFMQRCAFCHAPRTTKAGADAKAPSGGILAGLFQDAGPGQETRVRQIVLKGIPDKMPGFEYGLESEEIDAIFAYIKTLK
ncbi:MAG: cytochrome c [Acidobacteriota bacterium]